MNRIDKYHWIILLVVCLIFASPTKAETKENILSLSTAQVKQLQAASDHFKKTGSQDSITLQLNLANQTLITKVVPIEIKGKGYKGTITSKKGKKKDRTKTFFYSGFIGASEDKNFFKLTLIDYPNKLTEWVGFFRYDGKFYNLKSENDNSLQITQLSNAEIAKLIERCGAHVDEVSESDFTAQDFSGTSLKQADIATEADYEYYVSQGRSESRVNSSILAIINGVNGIYETQLGITLNVTFQHAWTTISDPYSSTDSSELLDQFTNYWITNYSNNKNYDLAHLWTGKELDSNIIGIAFLGTVCKTAKYGLSQNFSATSYDVPLAAHEIGHNFNANHDNCNSGQQYIMCPFLVANSSNFSNTSKSAISSFVSSATCLSNTSPAPTPTPTPVAHDPVLAAIGNKTVNENETLNIELSASDADGDSLTYSYSSSISNAGISGNNFNYAPGFDTVTNGNTSSQFTIRFTVTDSTGRSDNETILVTVNNINHSPSITTPTAQTALIAAKYSYNFTATDQDNDSLRLSNVSALPQGSVFDAANGIFYWKPANSQSGSNALVFRVTDSYGDYSETTLNLTVNTSSDSYALPTEHHYGDINGDGKAEISVFRPAVSKLFYQDISQTSETQGIDVGGIGSIPIFADYNGDKITDISYFDPLNQIWKIRYSGVDVELSYTFGALRDIPAVGDYDGDGRAELAIFRPDSGVIVYKNLVDNTTTTMDNIGVMGDIPVICDYDSDGKSDAAFFRQSTNQWIIKKSSDSSTTTTSFGTNGDYPFVGNYLGSNNCDKVIYRPSDSTWHINSEENILHFGSIGEIPSPADYDGDGKINLAVYVPNSNSWYYYDDNGITHENRLGQKSDLVTINENYLYASRISRKNNPLNADGNKRSILLYDGSSKKLHSINSTQSTSTKQKLKSETLILTGDYDGDGSLDKAFFTNGSWAIAQTRDGNKVVTLGSKGDIPISGDFDGDGKTDIAIFTVPKSSTSASWHFIKSTNSQISIVNFAQRGDVPVVGDFNGDGYTDLAVFRPTEGKWHVLDIRAKVETETVLWGINGDRVLVGDFDNDGVSDKVVWRPSSGSWYILKSSDTSNGVSVNLGISSDTPFVNRLASASTSNVGVYRAKQKAIYFRTLTSGVISVATKASNKAKLQK